MDPSSAPNDNTRYVLSEVYESPAGIQEHWEQAQKSWRDFGTMGSILRECNVQTLHNGTISQSLW